MNKKILSTTLFTLFFSTLWSVQPNLEGEKKQIPCIAKFGNASLVFYSDPIKQSVHSKFLCEIASNLCLGVDANINLTKTPLVRPLALVYPEPIGYDIAGNPLFADQSGRELIDHLMQNTSLHIEKNLGVRVASCTPSLKLMLNFDESSFEEIVKESPSLFYPVYIQDLSLIDWEMAKGTFAGFLLQTSETEERYLFPFFPHEVFQALLIDHDSKKQGKTTFISVLPPIDWKNSRTPGCGKGKITSFQLEGWASRQDINNLSSNCEALTVNHSNWHAEKLLYPNGIEIRKLTFTPQVNRRHVIVCPDLQDTEVLESKPEENYPLIAALQKIFEIECPVNKVKVKHLTKRAGGFTDLDAKLLDIDPNSSVILLNQSELPSGHCHYHISEDFTKQGLPWVQFYLLPPTRAMHLSANKLQDLSLTPIEKALYVDAISSSTTSGGGDIGRKIASKIDLFIFPPMNTPIKNKPRLF